MTTTVEIPLKPFPSGKIDQKFGGPAESPLEVLERARIALSPRGAWRKGGETGKSHEGASRCLIRAMRDADGVHVDTAAKHVLKAAKLVMGKSYYSIPTFNDAPETEKFHVIQALDLAIDYAKKEI